MGSHTQLEAKAGYPLSTTQPFVLFPAIGRTPEKESFTTSPLYSMLFVSVISENLVSIISPADKEDIFQIIKNKKINKDLNAILIEASLSLYNFIK